jgi:uncharacterized membrane protein
MIKNSVVIDRPIEAVFDYVAQFERHVEWQDDLKSSKLNGPPAVGVTGSDTRQMGRRTMSYDWEVTTLDRPNKIAFGTLTGPVRPVGSMSFSVDNDSTRVDFQMEMNPRGLMKLLGSKIDRDVQKTNVEHLAKLKQLMESGTS